MKICKNKHAKKTASKGGEIVVREDTGSVPVSNYADHQAI